VNTLSGSYVTKLFPSVIYKCSS